MRLSPELDGTFETSYDARERGELDQTVSLSLVVRNVDRGGEGEDATVYWQQTEPLDSVTVDSIAPGERVRVAFSRNMSAVEAETARIRNELGGSPGEMEVLVRATVHSRGTINGEAVDETDVFTLPVSFNGGSYSVSGADSTVESYETVRSVPTDRGAGSLRSIGGPLVLLLALGLFGLLTSSNTRHLSELERARMAYEDDRDTFDEWISTIRLPDEAFELPRAEADSLGELVDFAIDTDNSVIEAPDEDRYYVRHGGYLYTYRPPQEITALPQEETTVSDDPELPVDESTGNSDE